MSNEQVRQTNHHSNSHRATNTLTEYYSLPEVWSAVGPLFQYPHKHTDRTLHTARGVVSSGSIIPIPTQIQTEHYTLPEVWSAVSPLFQYPHKYRQSITHCQRCGQQWVHYSNTHTNTDRTLHTARGVVSSGSIIPIPTQIDRTLHTARGVVSSGSIIPIPTQIQTEHYTLPEVWSAVGTLFQYPYKHTDRTLLTARGVVSSGSSARGGGWPFSPQPIKGVGPILSPCAVVTVEVASNTSLSCAEIKAMF